MKTLNTVFVGKNLIELPQVGSTNTFAMELISKTNPIEGTCVKTDFQTAGRGQIGRYWFSSMEQNLLVSYIFYPKNIKILDQFYLNIFVSLAVRSTIEQYCDHVFVKWPNDVYVNDKKIAGILVQNILRENGIRATIVGIGLNVKEHNFPPELPNPTSIYLENEVEVERENVFNSLCHHLEFYYQKLVQHQFSYLKDEYLACLYKKNLWSEFRDENEKSFEGKILGIDSAGKLQVEMRDATKKYYNFREIQYIR